MIRRQRHDRPSETRTPTSQHAAALPGTATPTAIRAEVRAQLRDYPEVTAIDALLVADILGTDAIRSGRTVHRVRLYSQFPRLGIEVTSTPAADPLPRVPPGADDEGISRLLLEELTLCWDVERVEPLQTVWADLAIVH